MRRKGFRALALTALVVESYASLASTRAIAAALGVHHETVRLLLRRAGVTLRARSCGPARRLRARRRTTVRVQLNPDFEDIPIGMLL